MQRKIVLPVVDLTNNGDVFFAEGKEPVGWSIYAEADDLAAARTRIVLDNELVASITIHAPSRDTLYNEIQEVAAGLLWSAIRGWYYRKGIVGNGRTHFAIEVETPDGKGKLCDINFEPGRLYTCPDSDFVYSICYDDKHFVLLVSKGGTGTGERIFRRKRLPRDEKRVRLFNLYHYRHQHVRG